jgi:Protein of unknown function (DUF3592)
VRRGAMSHPIPADGGDNIRAAILAGRKIEAIDLYRRRTGVGAEEAREYVEAVERELRGTAPDQFAACRAVRGRLIRGFAVGFVLFGAMWVAIGIHESWPQWSRTSGLPRTEGTVAEFGRGAGDEADVMVVEYQVGDQSFRVRHKVVLSPGPYSAGQNVGVRYPPDRPQAGVVDTLWETWSLLLVLGGFGLVPAAIGVGVLWLQARSDRKHPATPHATAAEPSAADVT